MQILFSSHNNTMYVIHGKIMHAVCGGKYICVIGSMTQLELIFYLCCHSEDGIQLITLQDVALCDVRELMAELVITWGIF